MASWYYCTPGGIQRGPVDGEEIASMLKSGELGPNTLIRQKNTDWKPALTALAPAAGAASKPKSYDCPRCGSSDTKRLKVIHQQGTTETNAKTIQTGVGFGQFGLFIGGANAHATGTSQSRFAATAAPPQDKFSGGYGGCLASCRV